MWRKRSGFGYFRVFYQLFPILSPSVNLQEVMRVFVLYECGVCPSIVFLTLSRTWCCFLTEILFSSRVVRVSYVQGIWSSKSTTSAATSVGSFSTTYAYFEVCDVIFLALKSAFRCENHTGMLVGL